MVEIKSIKNAELFANEIDKLVWDLDIEYIEAVILYCEQKGLEVESVASLIKGNPLIKSKIQEHAEKMNCLPKTSTLEG